MSTSRSQGPGYGLLTSTSVYELPVLRYTGLLAVKILTWESRRGLDQ